MGTYTKDDLSHRPDKIYFDGTSCMHKLESTMGGWENIILDHASEVTGGSYEKICRQMVEELPDDLINYAEVKYCADEIVCDDSAFHLINYKVYHVLVDGIYDDVAQAVLRCDVEGY